MYLVIVFEDKGTQERERENEKNKPEIYSNDIHLIPLDINDCKKIRWSGRIRLSYSFLLDLLCSMQWRREREREEEKRQRRRIALRSLSVSLSLSRFSFDNFRHFLVSQWHRQSPCLCKNFDYFVYFIRKANLLAWCSTFLLVIFTWEWQTDDTCQSFCLLLILIKEKKQKKKK